MGTYKGMRDWRFYYNTHFPAIDTIVTLDNSIFDNEHLDNLKLEYCLKIESCCNAILHILSTSHVPHTAPTLPSPTSSTPSSFSFNKDDPSTTPSTHTTS